MQFSILTIFPDLVQSPLQEGIIRKARDEKKIGIEIVNIRNFAFDRHATTDDRPFGGGEGMVMKPEPLARAVHEVCDPKSREQRIILLSPQGRVFDQPLALELSREKHLVLICGRYEGVDERFTSRYVDDEISIGDFVVTGGELPALIIIDAVTRLLPGVLGCKASADRDTFSRSLLKHPQYTRPRVFEGEPVPEELLNGAHEKIREFRFIMSVKRTLERRPDLVRECTFSSEEVRLLKKHGLDRQVLAVQGKMP